MKVTVIRDAGYEPVRVGGLEMAASLEGIVDVSFGISQAGLGGVRVPDGTARAAVSRMRGERAR